MSLGLSSPIEAKRVSGPIGETATGSRLPDSARAVAVVENVERWTVVLAERPRG
jgi:hypothetical protein